MKMPIRRHMLAKCLVLLILVGSDILETLPVHAWPTPTGYDRDLTPDGLHAILGR